MEKKFKEMKFLVCALLVAFTTVNAASVFTMNVKEKMSVDFLTGFESGIFLTNNTKQFEEYGCPDQVADSKEIAAIKLGLQPIKELGSKGTFTGGKPIPELVDIIDTILLFTDSFDKFIGVFDVRPIAGSLPTLLVIWSSAIDLSTAGVCMFEALS